MIYLVEDDNNIRELVVYTLNNTGFKAEGFASASAFWQAVDKLPPSLCLLDIMLSGEDGLSILKKLKSSQKTAKIPVIMLTAKGTEYDKIVGLDTGADDYIPKPFGMMELLARIRAVLRRSDEPSQTVYEIGGLWVNIDEHRVKVDRDPVLLTYKEFSLLQYFLENQGIVLSREKILSHVWGYEFDGENRTVDVHIRTLRQKLGNRGDLIETVRGAGYRLGG